MMKSEMEKGRSQSRSDATAADGFEYEDEETKMDMFYELIRRFNQARDHHFHQHRSSFLQFRNQYHHQNQNQPQPTTNLGAVVGQDQTVVVSDKSAINYNYPDSNCGLKKRKINDVNDEDEDEITTADADADQLKSPSPSFHSGLDLNLAL
ncbi:hypothetical protein SOVF_059990 [Spinacia oleracea]|nr:hypothetical protein SOVF_059990 [Spinacia oleracea]